MMFSKEGIVGTAPFRRLAEGLEDLSAKQALRLRGLSGSLLAFAVATAFERSKRQVLVVAPDKDEAEKLRDDCTTLLGESAVRLAVAGPVHDAKLLDMSAPIAQLEALRSLSRGEAVVTVASAEALASRVAPPDQLRRHSMDFATGSEYPFEKLLRTLDELGFQRSDFVGEYGDYAVRGGIVDIFPFIGDNPLRFEFWGDTLESIREFEAISQRSIRELQSAAIVAQVAPQEDDDENGVSLLEYLSADGIVFIQEPVLVQKEIEELIAEGWKQVVPWEELSEALDGRKRIEHSGLFTSRDKLAVDFNAQSQPSFGGSVKQLIVQLSDLQNQGYAVAIACDTKEEAERLRELVEEESGSELGVGSGETSGRLGGEASERLGDLVNGETSGEDKSKGIRQKSKGEIGPIQFTTDSYHSGFVFPAAKIALFTEHEIFGRLRRRGTAKRKRFKGISHKELQQLRKGDFVVHADHGIGKFAGLQKLRVRGVEQEVMKLLYEENDVLYVNLNFVNRVQKYSSQEGHVPKLHKLGGPDWDRLRSKARKKIKDIARDLIQLYAKRKLEEGFAFAADSHWQKEMEASFQYEDTPDQAKATADVKMDMEQPSPMDRLICGDVGFGKTEVAVRAAFKSVMNGKQVAVLVPTTILASQHYNTFLDRLGRYSVRIEHLTRFRSPKEIKSIVADLKIGKVDIAIGTHRLLSKDIGFKDLGLLVIDEEQRFGVSAKEKLRQLRASVDTLTLTATPIPRTLQFSLLGARDLSLINTPPRNRLPITTEIAQFDVQLIREAILKELHRGGQVFFVHDRVHNIDEVRSMLEEHLPKVRFGVAHGQMEGHELERAILDFLERKHDVLICTKIIESGIDMPSVNTMIVNRADRFGLAELYQLRGRVGRSNVQAYAYLLTPPLSVLPRQTLRRLQAIQEFTELGSGFNLAMRDLEIRGAGNLLGGEQSGFILEMGFEMYQKIVEEAVAELKEQEFADVFEAGAVVKTKPETTVEADIEALIPSVYVESDGERLDIYRRLYRAEREDELKGMRSELEDRFGEYPEEVENLFRLVELKLAAAACGFRKVEIDGRQVVLTFPPTDEKEFYEGENAPFQGIMESMKALKRHQPRMKQEGSELRMTVVIEGRERVREVREVLEVMRG